MTYLRDHFRVVPLQDLVRDLRAGSLVDGSVAVTFDDGYRDNALEAFPILDQTGVPATFFVTAGCIGGSAEFWWDELDLLLENASRDQRVVTLDVDNSPRVWNVRSPSDLSAANREIHRYLKTKSYNAIQQVLVQLRRSTSHGLAAPRDTHQCMTREDLFELAKHQNVEIGAHTMTHCVLANETIKRQRVEIEQSKRALEAMTRKPVRAFSYPFGGHTDVSRDTRALVEEAGFTCGIANVQANVSSRTDPYWVPRRLVGDWDPNEFQRNLRRFLTHDRRPLLEELQKRTGLWRYAARRFYRQELLPKVATRPVNRVADTPPLNRVVHVNTIDSRGGAAKIALLLHQQLRERGYAVTRLVRDAIDDSDDISVLVEQDSARRRILEHAARRLGWPSFFASASLGIEGHPAIENAQLVHLHNLHGGYFSPFALPSLTAAKPTVWTLHDMASLTGHCAHSYECERWRTGCGRCPHMSTYESVETDATSFVWQTKRRIYELSDLTLVCPSRWLMEKIGDSILRGHDTHLIYNGVDAQVFADREKGAARAELGLPTDRTILLFAAADGTQNRFKGGTQMAAIVERTAKRDRILCVTVGGRTGFAGPNTLAVPYVRNERVLATYYAAADALVYPTAADNCPLVVLESLSCGTPVVAYGVGGVGELITHKQDGYVARSGEVADMVRGIDWVLGNGKRAGAAARAAVRERFTLEQMTTQYEHLYQQVFERRLRAPEAARP